MMDGRGNANAPLVTEGYQGPDLREITVDAAGSVSIRFSYLQVIYLEATKNMADLEITSQKWLFASEWLLSECLSWRSGEMGSIESRSHSEVVRTSSWLE